MWELTIQQLIVDVEFETWRVVFGKLFLVLFLLLLPIFNLPKCDLGVNSFLCTIDFHVHAQLAIYGRELVRDQSC